MRVNRRVGARGKRGQVLIIMALAVLLVFSVGALVIDGGLNYADKRQMQLTADAGALAGAASLGVLSGSSAATSALTNGQSYAWQNLRLSPPSGCLTTTPSGNANIGFTLTCSNAAFTITVTNPLYPSGTSGAQYTQDTSHSAYPPEDTVGANITHNNPSVGFARVVGFGATTIASHAVAEAQPGTRQFPFALATRYLDLQGNAAIQLYGAALVGACSSDGTGNFTAHNKNGGLYGNGQTVLKLGSSVDSTSGTTYYTSPEALVMADPATANCTGSNGNADAALGWTGFLRKVSFAQDAVSYNPFWAFNAGPASTNCSIANATQSACEWNWYGDTTWNDTCWQSGGTDVSVLGDTPAPTYDANSSAVPNPNPGTGIPVLCSLRR
ncbi:MAG: hypothetical protein E6J45_08020 [Chloroflexi bacterium]|nr:MAG: hypothetical protein E6J45_08020 [Chloroflexota bacterium]